MEQNQFVGAQSVRFSQPVYIKESASIVGEKEGEGPLGMLFDQVSKDPMFGGETWEEAESRLQKKTVDLVLKKAGCQKEDVRYLFAGDLLGQSMASIFGLVDFARPLLGLFGACSTSGLALGLGSMCIAGGFAKQVLCVTSSHFCSVEKEFRYPLGYGNQRPLSASWTVTGCGAFLLSDEYSITNRAMITGVTFGKMIDYGLKDSMNMGCCMAPAAADTVKCHLQDFGRTPEDYDKIITGDLGKVGQKVLIDLLSQEGIDISENHTDCGIEIFDGETQDTHAGGSGCGCAASTLSAYILRQMEKGEWKRVLFVPTGALMSKTSYNEGNTVPGIAHAVVIERI